MLVSIPLAGAMEMESTLGDVFSMDMEACEVACSPVGSVAVMVQVTTSLGCTLEGVKVMEEELPNGVEPLLQLYP